MIKRVIKQYKGDFIFKEGDVSDAMYIIEKGEIAITKQKGKLNVTLAELYADDLFGEMAFFNNSIRNANAVVSSTSAHLAVLPYSALKNEYSSLPGWIKAVIKSINSHLITANSRIQELEKIIKINNLT